MLWIDFCLNLAIIFLDYFIVCQRTILAANRAPVLSFRQLGGKADAHHDHHDDHHHEDLGPPMPEPNADGIIIPELHMSLEWCVTSPPLAHTFEEPPVSWRFLVSNEVSF